MTEDNALHINYDVGCNLMYTIKIKNELDSNKEEQ